MYYAQSASVFNFNFMKKYIFLLLGILFFLPFFSNASVLYSQTDNIEIITTTSSIAQSRQTLGTGLTGTINKIKFYASSDNTGTTQKAAPIIMCYTNNSYDTLCPTNSVMFGSYTPLLTSTKTLYEILLDESNNSINYIFNPNYYYILEISAFDLQGGRTMNTYGSTNSNYSNGACYKGVYLTLGTLCNIPADLFFILEDSLNINSLTLVYPDGQTILPVDMYFTVNWTLTEPLGTFNEFICFYTDNSTLLFQNEICESIIGSGNSGTLIYIPELPYELGNYTWKARLKINNNYLLYTNSLSFTVSNIIPEIPIDCSGGNWLSIFFLVRYLET